MGLVATRNEAAQLSNYLRTGTDAGLRRRRGVIALSALSMVSMAVIALYQTGVLAHLPEPPWAKLDADKVDASPEAYAILRTPDAALGALSYAATLVLAAMEGKARTTERPILPLLLAAKAGGDAAMAAKLSVDQWTKHKAFCLWCLAAAAATFATVPLVLPEARIAWKSLGRSR